LSQHDLDIANQTFPNTRSDLNNALQALGSTSSGATVPSTTYANQLWYDTANNKLYIRNEDNDANIEIMELDQTNDTVEYFKSDSVRTTLIEYSDGTDALTIGSSGELTTSSTLDVDGNELILDSDGDTSITADTDDQIDFKIAGSDKVVLDANGLKINGSTSGGITISAPAVAGTNTLTLPASTSTIATTADLPTNTPLFSVTVGSNQTGIGDAVVTKIAFDTVRVEQGVTFDTTNYRFTVPSGGAGIYKLDAFAQAQTSSSSDLAQCYIRPYLNGSATANPLSNFILNTNYGRAVTPHVSRIYDLSVGDYLEMYIYIDSVSSARQVSGGQAGWTMYKLIT